MVGLHLGVVGVECAELDKAFDVGVHPATADFVSSGLREVSFPEAREERAGYHHRTAQLGTFADKLRASDVLSIELCSNEGVLALGMARHFHSHTAEQVYQVERVQDFRHVVHVDRGRGKQDCANHLESLVLCSLRGDRATELVTSFDNE